MRWVVWVLLLSSCVSYDYVTPWFRRERTAVLSWDKEAKETVAWQRRTNGKWTTIFTGAASPLALANQRLVVRAQQHVEIHSEDQSRPVHVTCTSGARLSPDRTRVACIDRTQIHLIDQTGVTVGNYDVPTTIAADVTTRLQLIGFVRGEATLLAVEAVVPMDGKIVPRCHLYALQGEQGVTLITTQQSRTCGAGDVSAWKGVPGVPAIEVGTIL